MTSQFDRISGRLNRRDFLRLCVLAAGGVFLEACDQALPVKFTPTPAATATTIPTLAPTLTPSPQAPFKITLDGWQVDAWTWQKEVRGAISGAGRCEEIMIEVNGTRFPAVLQDSRFSATVPLGEGENKIFAYCQQPGGQEEKSLMLHYYERLQKAPKAKINIGLEAGKVVFSAKDSQAAEAGGAAITGYLWSARAGNPEPLKVEGKDTALEDGPVSGESLALAAPQADGEYYVNLQVKDQEGRQDNSTIYFVVKDGQAVIPDYATQHVDWVEKAVVYGIVPSKFGLPAFNAITSRLDDLADLGVTALWLAPVNVSPPGDYGYAVVDYFSLNPSYGSEAEFRRMVREAHARGIRIVMDFVPNHSSIEHPYFKDARKNGEESLYWNFYDRDSSGDYTYYFNWDYLPNLNYSNPEVQKWMTEAFAYWVREFDVDGFRVDCAWAVKQRLPEYWPQWRAELHRIKPDLMLLAEASARDPYYFDSGYDIAYDWTNELGKWAWELVWTSYKNRLLAYNLDAVLTNRPDGFHPDAMVFRFLNNNDTNERFITKYGVNMARVATALLLTLPGIPCVYTGDEVGAEFHPYFNPEALDWKEKVPGWRDYHKKLIQLRRDTPALHSRLWQALQIKPIPQTVYTYVRYTGGSDQPVVVALNFAEEAANVEFELPEPFQAAFSTGTVEDLLTGEKVTAEPGAPIAVTVPPMTAMVLMPVG